MSEYQGGNPFDIPSNGTNPYGIAPANNVSMTDAQRHESGNALAANAEARAVAEVKAQVLMARQFPRDPRLSMERILRECERPTLAEQAVYTFPRSNETVTGPSIRLAEVMARNWGNVTFGLEVLERKTGDRGIGYSVLRAFAWDLETNTYISRQFELKHWRQTKSGGYALKEDRDIYELEANMGSRRMRVCILQVLPGDVTQTAVDKCRRVLRDLNARLGGHLSQEESDALELAADAVTLLARAETQNDYGAFVHRIRKDKGQAPIPVVHHSLHTLECPACGAWIDEESRLQHTPDELLQCMHRAYQ